MSKLNELGFKGFRKTLGLTQAEFWSAVGVGQAGGSRYESGRNIPSQVMELIRLVHIEKFDLNKIDSIDLEIAHLLKQNNPEVFKTLRKNVRSRKKDISKTEGQ